MSARANTTRELVNLNRKDATEWTVLIVDDERDNLDVISRLLTFLGATVKTAECGTEALDILKTVTPTFILSDLMMPDMDGWKLNKAIRSNPATATIPVIAITASTMNVDRFMALGSGFDGYIAKPFSISTFLMEIQRCLTAANQVMAQSTQDDTPDTLDDETRPSPAITVSEVTKDTPDALDDETRPSMPINIAETTTEAPRTQSVKADTQATAEAARVKSTKTTTTQASPASSVS